MSRIRRRSPKRSSARSGSRKGFRTDSNSTFPEIADYELRRKLLHLESRTALARLDELKSAIGYLPITTDAMLKAAEFWAEARRKGLPTAPEAALDADVILAAQAAMLTGLEKPSDTLVATDNVGHLGRFVAARRWRDIR